MMKKRVFITGATGNMGWATVQEFMSRLDRFDVMVLARDFVLTRHNPNKFGFCSRLLQNSLFDCVKGALRIYTDVTRFARFLSLTELLFLTECTEETDAM